MFRVLLFFLGVCLVGAQSATAEPPSPATSTAPSAATPAHSAKENKQPSPSSTSQPKASHPATLERALAQAQSEQVHLTREWINLGHYKKFPWGWQSEADGLSFFLSPNGQTDPQAELEATLKGFFSTELRHFEKEKFPSQSARCQFPARWLFLSKRLSIKDSDLPPQPCTEYVEFKTRVAAKSATLIFASYNIDNPSSAFGHTLLRLNRAAHGESKRVSLLDIGVNYAANPWTTNPFLYGALGLSGFFPGTYAAMQYYYKVREYSDFDSRDLWEYNLSLNQDEVDVMVAHIWELGFTYFNYYFFTSNCSYHMVTLLDVAAPRLHLVDRLSFWVVPADTIKVTWQTPELVRDVVYRPSLNKQYLARLAKLTTPQEQAAYKQLQDTKDPKSLPVDVNDDAKARVLDTVIDRFDMDHFFDLAQENSKARPAKDKLLIARSKLPTTEELVLPAENDDRPHIAHDSMRLSYSQLINPQGQQGFEVTQRFALHDLADPVDGYPKTAKIEFFKFTVNGSYEENDIYVRNIDILSVQTIQPLSTMEKPYTWKARLGFDRVLDERCWSGCLSGTAEGSVGYTFPIWAKRILFYTLLQTHVRTSPKFEDDKFTLEGGPQVGLRAIINNSLILHAESGWQWGIGIGQQISTTEAHLRWSPIYNWSVDAGYRYQFFEQNYMASIHYYF